MSSIDKTSTTEFDTMPRSQSTPHERDYRPLLLILAILGHQSPTTSPNSP